MKRATKYQRDLREIQHLLTRAILLADRQGLERSVLCLIELKKTLPQDTREWVRQTPSEAITQQSYPQNCVT